jgi:hypothetical protein
VPEGDDALLIITGLQVESRKPGQGKTPEHHQPKKYPVRPFHDAKINKAKDVPKFRGKRIKEQKFRLV